MSSPSSRIVPSVGSIRRSSSLPTVDLPQPDSPTRHSVSPGLIAKLTPSTALIQRDRAREQAALQREMLLQARRLRRPGSCGDRRREHALGLVAGDDVAVADRAQLRRLDAAALDRVGAARRERAALDRLAQRRHDAGDLGEAALAVLRAAGAGSRPSGRACRDAPGGRTARRSAASSILRPAYITITRRAGLGHDAEIVRDQDHGGAGALLQLQHQVEDLRLDGDVERGGRLVGDQQASDCRRAPSRSSRAGACRRRTGADSRRAAARRRGS